MDGSDDEAGYLAKPYPTRSSSLRQRRTTRNQSTSYSMRPHYREDDDFGYEDNGFGAEEDNAGFDFDDNGSWKQQKKRKFDNSTPDYEFGSRGGGNLPKSSRIVGSSRGNWGERDSLVLLEVWGNKYLELGRRSLRAEDWLEVSEKVSEMSGVERGEMECRNQLGVLKKKYKKEKAKMEGSEGEYVSQWGFYKKMDGLLNLKMKGHCGLGCGVDSGEYIFMNPRVYLDRSNVLDEMRDSPAESDEDQEEQEDGSSGEQEGYGESAKLLANSIQRFGEIYEKIEESKRRQIMELEKMRRDFQRELELQKKQIIERAQLEIDKIRERSEEDEEEEEDEDEEEEGSTDNDDDDDDDGGDNYGNGVPPMNLRR